MCLIFVGRLLSQVAKKSRFLSTVYTLVWPATENFTTLVALFLSAAWKVFFALFWCDHVLRLVFIVKLPFCTLSTFARTVWLAGAGWLWATSIHTLYLNEGVERAMTMRWKPFWSTSVILQDLPQNLKRYAGTFFLDSSFGISGNEFDQIMDIFIMIGTLAM